MHVMQITGKTKKKKKDNQIFSQKMQKSLNIFHFALTNAITIDIKSRCSSKSDL